MHKSEKTRALLFLLNVISFILGEYLKEIFMYLHKIISSMSPEFFTFLMIILLAIILSAFKE